MTSRAATFNRLQRIRSECRELVRHRAELAALTSAVSLPGLDLGMTIALLLEMFAAINRKFGLTPEQIQALPVHRQAQLLGVTAQLGNRLIGRAVTRQTVAVLLRKLGMKISLQAAAKIVPVAGNIAAGAIHFGTIRMLGNRHIGACYEVRRRLL